MDTESKRLILISTILVALAIDPGLAPEILLALLAAWMFELEILS